MIPLRYNLRSLARRRSTTIATALGVALVVFVLASALMLAAGVKKTLAAGGRDDVAIVIRKGSESELSSVISTADASLVQVQTGVRQRGARAEAVGEVVVVIALEKLGADGVTNVQLRGVPDNVLEFRKNVRFVAGRAPRPGSDEAVVGSRLRGRFRGLDLGQSFELKKNRTARVVGVFEADGASHESEVWIDLDTMRSTFAREGMVSSVRVQLESTSAFDGFQKAVEQDKRVGLEALREKEYYERLSEGTSAFLGVLGTVLALFLSVGAMIGAMITMYAAVAQRRREIGTLRTIGFGRFQVLASFLVESVLLALGGGLIGCLGATAMGSVRFSFLNFASWSEVVFKFEPTPAALTTALVFAGVMGVLGGLLPAVRAARLDPIQAIRD